MSEPFEPSHTRTVPTDLRVEHGSTPIVQQDPEPQAGTPSLGELLKETAADLSLLVRQEIQLLRAEMTQEATKAGRGAGELGGAGVAGFLMLIFLSTALMWALGSFMPNGWAALIVAALWGVVAGVLFLRGRQDLRKVNPKPEQTIDTVKEDVQWAKDRKS